MKYKIVTKLAKNRWSSFVENHTNGNIFQTPEMYKVYQKTKNYEPIFLAVIDNDDTILGVMLAVIQKEYSGIIGSLTARSIIFGGPLIKDENIEVLDVVLKEYSTIAKSKAIYSQFRNFWDWQEPKNIFSKNGFEYEEHLNILVDLNKSEDELWKDVKKSRKEGIRKAIRDDLQFSVANNDEILPTFYGLLKETYSNAKLPYPDFDFFNNLQKLIPTNTIKYFTLKKENNIIIALLAYVYKGCLSAFYIGINREEKYFKMRPVDLFYWELLKWGSENNCEIYDWLGAGKPDKEYGVRKFKLQFGGKIVNYGRFEKIHKPILLKIAKFGFMFWKGLKR
ncbi:MAG: peptidoglycan bridge formation glycyltransferase FemA/FemB family protein [Candidatus Cloacimonetes bacterium]|jgi:serine/alanine adding enzyme|nr:peptidoglycan bridge formation glycyltransferase FemA/FemB family protein [Candidatus Cloacimonadota bacterium]MBT6994549.1 peptidoglycan bridge formation glycyltransferase FemA/FemB family protein [Candidatus Cloacimonadota bacterium]